MVAWRKPQHVTVDEYLDAEYGAGYRSEYFGGVVVAMADAKVNHNRTAADTLTDLNIQLHGRGCEAFSENMKVRIEACERYFYPDVVVACGAQFERRRGTDSLVNPELIVEVLSESTEKLDREEKFDCYAALESLKVYVLASQDHPRVEVYTRQEDDSWRRDVAKGLNAEIALPALGCTLRLSEMYARVEFPPAEPPRNRGVDEN